MSVELHLPAETPEAPQITQVFMKEGVSEVDTKLTQGQEYLGAAAIRLAESDAKLSHDDEYLEDALRFLGTVQATSPDQVSNVPQVRGWFRNHGLTATPPVVQANLERRRDPSYIDAGNGGMYERKLNESLDTVRSALGRFSDGEQHAVEAAVVDAADKNDFPKVFRHWQAAAGYQDANFVSWLAEKPENGGPTNEQLLNVMQWNLDRMVRMNSDPVVQETLESYRHNFEQNLERAIDAGELPEALRDKYKQESARTPMHVTDTFLAVRGAASAGKAIILRPDFDEYVVIHENSHLFGKASEKRFDEGVVDVISQVIERHGEQFNDHGHAATYHANRDFVRAALELSGHTEYELAEAFARSTSSDRFDILSFTQTKEMYQNWERVYRSQHDQQGQKLDDTQVMALMAQGFRRFARVQRAS